MSLSNEQIGSKILAKIKIYILTRAELLFTLCYEIPCKALQKPEGTILKKTQGPSINIHEIETTLISKL